MFYSYEILTSRRYGVATVWLAATLGPQSSFKKRFNRKAIFEVDVPKACETILTPEAPMALRLQSNLLFGVSRVYSKQCEYILTDAQAAHNQMRTLLKVIKGSYLDQDAGKARPEQLMVQDDPSFLPELDFPMFELDMSSLSATTSFDTQHSSLFSPHTAPLSLSSPRSGNRSIAGLIIPTSDTDGLGDIGGFALPGDNLSSAQRGSRTAVDFQQLMIDDGFLPDADFEFDAEGNIANLDPLEDVQTRDPSTRVRPMLGSDDTANRRVRTEHDAGLGVGPQFGEAFADGSFRPRDDGFNLLSEAEPFPREVDALQDQRASSKDPDFEAHESSESAEAPARRRVQAPKIIQPDQTLELSNADLRLWDQTYVASMAAASKLKRSHRGTQQAKKNAFHWVFGAGIGGVGSSMGQSHLRSPLEMFSGEKLMEDLSISPAPTSRNKRSRDTDPETTGSESEGRNVKRRNDEEKVQIGRRQDLEFNDDAMLPAYEDEGVEIGRAAAPGLDDHSSAMPWNISASLQGSRQGSAVQNRALALSSVTRLPPSAGDSSAVAFSSAPFIISGRHSRLASASPLLSRSRASGIERLGSLGGLDEENEDALLGENREPLPQSDDNNFEFFGAYANIATQTAADSQWMKKALDTESLNFLEYVKAAIKSVDTDLGEDDISPRAGQLEPKHLTFAALLPPAENSKLVAAQGFHHLLDLASRNLMSVAQASGFGDILLSPLSGA